MNQEIIQPEINQELTPPLEQLVQAYNALPEAWTRRFEILEGISEDSLNLRHRTVNLSIELSPLPGVPLECLPGCSDTEHITYIPIARFQASLYAPLENIASPEEGIDALRTLQKQEQNIHLSLPCFGGEQIAFDHYDEGVEYTYDIPQVRLEGLTNGVRYPYWHALSNLMRSFSFISYNFNMDVDAPLYHPGTEIFKRRGREYLQFQGGYETRNPTAKIMGDSGDGRWLNFWSEDEETLIRTSEELQAIAESIQNELLQSDWQYRQYRQEFKITSTIKRRELP